MNHNVKHMACDTGGSDALLCLRRAGAPRIIQRFIARYHGVQAVLVRDRKDIDNGLRIIE